MKQALRLVAVLGQPTARELRAGRISASALEEAVDRHLLDLDGDRLRFAHPLLASGIEAITPPDVRRRVHRLAAQVVEDAERRARHLALAAEGPDEDIAAALDAAASRASRRGGFDVAAELRELAVALTPPEDVERFAERVAAVGRSIADWGDPARAVELLEQAFAAAPPGSARARARLALALQRLGGRSSGAGFVCCARSSTSLGSPSPTAHSP